MLYEGFYVSPAGNNSKLESNCKDQNIKTGLLKYTSQKVKCEDWRHLCRYGKQAAGAMAARYTCTPFTSFSYRNFSWTFSSLFSEKDKILSVTDMTENNAERFSSAVLSRCLAKLQTASKQRSSLFLLVQLSGDNMWFTMMSLFPFSCSPKFAIDPQWTLTSD